MSGFLEWIVAVGGVIAAVSLTTIVPYYIKRYLDNRRVMRIANDERTWADRKGD